MKIIKIEKIEGKLKGFYSFPYDGVIGLRDKIWFICENCNKETSKQKRRLKEEYPYCEKCLRKIKLNKIYGVDNVFQLKEVKEKIKNTNLQKYGEAFYTKTKEYKKKSLDKQIKKFGDYYTRTEDFLNRLREKQYLKSYNNKKNNYINVEIITDIKDYNGVKNSYLYRCKKCGNIFESSIQSYNIEPRCKMCFPYEQTTSIKEKEIAEFVKSLNKVPKTNEKIIYPYELDIYLEEEKIGIEFNGNYWHSEENLIRTKKISPVLYHSHKTILCEKKGIFLLHFFEDEWDNKKDIVKSIIKNKLDLIEEKIMARNTIIKEIDFNTKKDFLDKNHLQGSDFANINLGLYYKDELVSVMTFYKENKKHDNWVLSRFASKLNLILIGGASKLLKYFIKKYNPEKIISFSDKRISNGNLYKALNFKYVKTNKPAYWYVKNIERFHRFNFRKKFIKKKFPNIYDKNKTEREMMIEAGYDRIWDCGNDKWELILKR